MKLIKKAKKAFTLVELITVMAIIAVLAGVSVGAYFGIVNNAKQSAARQEADQIKTQLVAATSGDGYAVEAATCKYDTVTGFTAVMTDVSTVTFTFTGVTTATDADVRYAIGYIVAENNGTLDAKHVADYANAIVVTGTVKDAADAITGFSYVKNNKWATTTFNGTTGNGTSTSISSISVA
jgi:prepilin-type N-terminal cleavage/methylation domain-containing protein